MSNPDDQSSDAGSNQRDSTDCSGVEELHYCMFAGCSPSNPATLRCRINYEAREELRLLRLEQMRLEVIDLR